MQTEMRLASANVCAPREKRYYSKAAAAFPPVKARTTGRIMSGRIMFALSLRFQSRGGDDGGARGSRRNACTGDFSSRADFIGADKPDERRRVYTCKAISDNSAGIEHARNGREYDCDCYIIAP